MSWTRRRFLGTSLLMTLFGLRGKAPALAADVGSKQVLSEINVRNAGQAFIGDGARFATISPRSVGGRERALLGVRAREPVDVVLEVVNRNAAKPRLISSQRVSLAAGQNAVEWGPAPSTAPGSYILRLRAQGPDGSALPGKLGSAVVRVLDVEATFGQRSALPGDRVTLDVQSSARWLKLTLLRCGLEDQPTNGNAEMKGVAVTEPVRLDLTRSPSGCVATPVTLDVTESGLYAARLEGPSGHLGFAPLVVRPTVPTHRVAVVLPTTTWQAYNFTDSDRDGFGDTWYSIWQRRRVDLTRPHLRRGVPYRYRSYDLQSLQWLRARGHQVDIYADEDIERFAPEALRAAYDLIVFPGHTEYTTRALYDIISSFRDAGGNLLFLSANNFFREVVRENDGDTVRLTNEWRRQGRPEAALLGAQYLANDGGQHQAAYTIVGADIAPWAFAGTGLGNGGQFGKYGIEIDATAPESPVGTQVLAHIPDLLGPGRTAEMTYYETPAGARVFSAGVLNFGGTCMLWPQTRRILDNIWARLTDTPV